MRLLFFALLFLVGIPSKSQIQLISNGDFEGGVSPWLFSSQYWNYATTNNSICITSLSHYAYHGNANGSGANNSFGGLFQDIFIPPNVSNAQLSFSLSINTQETTQSVFDVLEIQIRSVANNALLYTFGGFSNLNGFQGSCAPYSFVSFPIPSNFFGQQVRIYFQAANDQTLPTIFRIDNVSVLANQGGGGCVNWVNGTPSGDQELITATEYLCNNGIIPNLQVANQLDEPISLVDECSYVANSLFNPNSQLPSDYYPILHTDVDVGYYNASGIRALRAMLYLEYNDGKAPLSRDYFYLKTGHGVDFGKGLRVMLEAWNQQGNWSGYDQYSTATSNFMCMPRNDPYYGYYQTAYNNGWLNGFLFNGGCSGTLPYLPQYLSRRIFFKLFYRILTSRPYPNPTVSSFYQPLNISTQNANTIADLHNGAFSNYEETSFNISGAGLPLIFRHVYNSSQQELPILNQQTNIGLQSLEHVQREGLTPLGDCWTHSFNIYMQSTQQANSNVDNNLVIRWGDGTVHVYDLLQHKYSTKGIYDVLVVTSTTPNGNPNTILITKKDQTQYSFKRDNLGEIFTLQSIKDRNNNYLIFKWIKGVSYNLNGVDVSPLRLERVYDSITRRAISFFYQSGANYLSSVTDNIGRTLFFNVSRNTHNLTAFIDAKGQTTNYQYGTSDVDAHLLMKIQRPKGNFIDNTFQNRKIKSTQANQYKVSVNFSANYIGSGNSTQASITVTPQTGQSYTTNYQNDYLGNTVQINSATSSKTIQYNDANNPTLPTKVIDNNLNVTNQLSYDLRGNTLLSERVAPGFYSSEQFQYNGFNDVTRHVDALANATNYMYDSRGNLIFKTLPNGDFAEYIRNSNGTVHQINDNGIVTHLGYNIWGNIDSLWFQSVNVSAKAYYDNVSRVIAIRNPNGSVQGIKYDNNDNITETVDDSLGMKVRRNYTYDPNDNLIRIKNANGHSTALDYDFNTDDLIQETFGPFTKQWSYNNDGSVKTRKNKKNNVFNYSYYPQGNQLEGFLQTDGYATYTYNNQTRQLTSVDRQGKSITYGYDNVGRVNRVQYNDFPNNQLFYEYDVNDNVTKVTYPGGKSIRYLYDANNRLTGLVDWNNQNFTEYHYQQGRLDYETHGGVGRTYYKYDLIGRLMYIGNMRFTDTLSSYTAHLDPAGNHLQETRKENYNPLPDDFPTNPILTYTYDSINRLKTANTTTLTYDNDGNTTGYGSTVYTYDPNNLLLTTPTDIYEYDGLGNRRRKNNTRYVVDVLNGNKVMMETDLAGNPKVLYAYGIGLARRHDLTTNQDFYYNYDFRGSTTSILDGTGGLVNWYTYAPYGETLRKTESIQQPFKYVGKYGVQYENDSLYFMQARYYNPKIGRFLSEDPVWQSNLYPYGENNPLVNIDPDGKDAWDFVPVVGSSRDAINSFKKGNYGWAVFHAAMAISDIFLVKSLATGIVKAGIKMSAKTEGVAAFKGIAARTGTNSVYQGVDKAGIVRYIGITERETSVRFAEHLNSGTANSLLQYRVVNGATGLGRTQARVWEQTLINQYGLQRNGGVLLNKINSIAPKYWWQYGIR